MSSLLRSLLMGVWIYSLILWGYVVAENLVNDFRNQFSPLSIYVPLPEDLVAVLAFVASFASFVVWDYLRRRSSGARTP